MNTFEDVGVSREAGIVGLTLIEEVVVLAFSILVVPGIKLLVDSLVDSMSDKCW